MIHGPTLRLTESTKLNRGLSLLHLLIPLYTRMMIWQMLRDAAQKCGQICHWAIHTVGSHLEAAVSRKRKAEDEPPELQSFGWNCFSGVGWESNSAMNPKQLLQHISGCWFRMVGWLGWWRPHLQFPDALDWGLVPTRHKECLEKDPLALSIRPGQRYARKHGMWNCLWLFGRSWMVPKLLFL